jgi:predicted RNA-binding protein YlxR (DUF448 family)
MGSQTTVEDADAKAADSGPLRLCAVSRVQMPPEELIRFVAGPDLAIVPDLARRLPGRGVWVGATRDAVAEAVRRKVFAKSLKKNVSVPADLADLVERLLRKRLAEAVSIANKAGLLVVGFAKVAEAIEAGRAFALIHAVDAAADGVDKLDRKFKALGRDEGAPATIVRELASAELSLAFGRSNVIHAAAAEGGASRRLIEEARRLGRYRLGPAQTVACCRQHEPTQDVHD